MVAERVVEVFMAADVELKDLRRAGQEHRAATYGMSDALGVGDRRSLTGCRSVMFVENDYFATN